MPVNNAVADHYTHGNLLEAIRTALSGVGKSPDNITTEDLVPVDEFHIGGRQATERFIQQLGFSAQDHVLDIGCGLGGPARFIAEHYNSRVTGIDLTPEYIETGNILCDWVGLNQKVELRQGSALAMPFDDESFDGACMLHVGMNIADKAALFSETRRVLRPGAHIGIYDVMRTGPGELIFPVPWAGESDASHLAEPVDYRRLLESNGFEVSTINNRARFALEFFAGVRAETEAAGGPPPLGLHTLIGGTAAVKFKNLVENLKAGQLAPVEMIARRL